MATGVTDREAQLIDLLATVEQGRQALIDALWAKLESDVEEFGYQAAGLQVDAPPQLRVPVRINYVLAVVPSGTTGTLYLGSRLTIPLVSGLNQLQGCGIILQPSDLRRLVIGAAGTLALLLTGEARPTYGKLR